MPETGENVAAEFGISRKDQDAYSFSSQQRAARAKASGFFAAEIVPIATKVSQVSEDEHPRPDTTLEALAKLKPVVRPDGTVTAGNASGVNDGAAAMLVASEAAINAYGLRPKARILAMASAGVAPRIMGIGPVPAVRKLLGKLQLTLRDFDFIEINEAFASQVLACVRQFGLPDDADFVNPNGGAIALGHPLGMSGARLLLTAAHQLEISGARRILATMCVGVGQGVAFAIERIE
jgi:3-oxoadipyl-CoA thiolase